MTTLFKTILMMALLTGTVHANVMPPPGFWLQDKLTQPDPAVEDAWWLQRLEVVEAWNMATGYGVTIADCDAGFYTGQMDIARNLVMSERRDLSDNDFPTQVSDGTFVAHGTAVASIMVGVLDGEGVNGIAFDASLVPLQNFNYDANLDDLDKEEATARCIMHALLIPQVQIIVVQSQTKLGSPETDSRTREVVREAIKAGVVVVSAAGNSSLELLHEAEQDTGSIIVGAVGKNDRKAFFSNFGSRVTLSAYGEKLRMLHSPSGVYKYFSGTTAASAQVAATVALMLEANPKLTPVQVRSILETTSQKNSDNMDVGGILNVYEAVQAALNEDPDEDGFNASQAYRAYLLSMF